MKTCILPSAYLAPVDYYVQLARHEQALIEVCDHYQKQSYRNRCAIASPQGRLDLTIPVVKPEGGKAQMRDIRISDHGNWRHLHWNALVSSYRRSPFFEYYADDFAPFYERKWEFLADFNEELQQIVCQLIDLQPNWQRTDRYEVHPEADDFRDLIHPRLEPTATVKPYYQVFSSTKSTQESSQSSRLSTKSTQASSQSSRLSTQSTQNSEKSAVSPQNFLPGLSIVDLLFNMGPEAILYIL